MPPEGLYEEAVESLQHPDAAVRQEAVVFLGRHLRKRDDAQVLLEMVAADPSPEVRKLSAQCLGGIFRSTRNRQVNQVLAEAAKTRMRMPRCAPWHTLQSGASMAY